MWCSKCAFARVSHANTQRNFSFIYMCILFWLICCTPLWIVSVCVLWRYTETIHKLPVMSKVMCFILLEVLISAFYAVASRGISTNERNDSPGCWVISGCPAVLWYSAVFLKLVFVMEIYWKFTGMYWENFILLEEILCKNGISQHEVLKYFSMPYIINF